MASTRKKKQSKRRLLGQLDDFDQDVIIGNTVRDRQENATVIEATSDQEFTVGNLCSDLATNENAVNVKTLEKCFNEKIDREIGNVLTLSKIGFRTQF